VAQAAAWTVVSSPNPGAGNGLFGVASISANDVWAVGNFSNIGSLEQTLTLHWNGKKWSHIKSPNVSSQDSELMAVAAVSPTDVWAVGDSHTTSFQTLTQHWDGHKWSVVSSPNPGAQFNELFGVAAVSPTDVWAVGDSNTSGSEQTLIEHWNGTSWSIVSSPNPGAGGLNGVAIISATDIWAVGAFFNTTNNVTQTLIEQWNGTSWSVVTSPNPSSTTNLLEAAAADKSSGQAWAVGQFTAASGATQTLTEFNP
jgi:hypothetical protein